MKIDKSVIKFLRKKKECDDVVLHYTWEDSNLSRFAENRIIQNMSKRYEQLTIEAIKDERVGSVKTTKIDSASLLRTLRTAESIASAMPKDPEFVPPLKPEKSNNVQMDVGATARITPRTKAKSILDIVKKVKSKSAKVAGIFYNGRKSLSILNTRGFFANHSLTNADFSVTVSADDSSGFAEETGEDVRKIDVERAFNVALSKAEMGKKAVKLKPGDYPVLLEPIALGSLMWYLKFLMERRSADEGWSYFSKKLGKKIASPSVTIFSDPLYPKNPGVPFDVGNDGLPLKKNTWIKDGILKKLWTSRYWAKKNGLKPTGMPSNLIMKGSKKSTEELVKKINYGLLITRLWYIRFVNRKELILTGMTRDGLFLIENGKITKAVKNMRFNDSPFTILSKVKYLGKPERVEGEFFMPSVFAKKFHFASTTKF